MHSHTTTAPAAGQSAVSPIDGGLEFVNYGNGYAWLRPALDAADQLADDIDRLLDRQPEAAKAAKAAKAPTRRYVLPARFWITDAGRRALAVEALFGSWPTVADITRSASPAFSPVEDQA